VCPQIPFNTGNIGRTCASAGIPLHLIKPLGFSLDDRYLKRSGLDYWPHVDLVVHESLETFDEYRGGIGGRRIAFSAPRREFKSNLYTKVEYKDDDWLLFGCESNGLPENLILDCEKVAHIPVKPEIRSLNLSTCVGIVLFEGLRQLDCFER